MVYTSNEIELPQLTHLATTHVPVKVQELYLGL